MRAVSHQTTEFTEKGFNLSIGTVTIKAMFLPLS